MINKPSSCAGCPLYDGPIGKKVGYVPASGTGDNGVLVVLEAAGEHEEVEGIPTVGKAGYFLWQNLKRVGIDREGFCIHNALSCRPPNNKLAGMPYEQEVISKCSPNLDATVFNHTKHARSLGLTPVIVTLGKIAFKRVMGDEFTEHQAKYDYLCYPLWNNRYGCWVIAADHPSYLMRGQTHLLPVMQFAFQRALEIAKDGLRLDEPDYLLNPTITQFAQWIEEYEDALLNNPEEVFLSYDIETPHKKNADEETLEKDEDDYVILQCSFSYKPNHAVSARWDANNRHLFEQIFASSGPKLGWNSQAYDDPRILAQMPIHGTRYDAMQMWHVLNSALPKGLGFVTPYYVPTTTIWKYLGNSEANGAFYNAKDADMALRNFLGIRNDLMRTGQWDVYNKHVVQVHRVFNYMSEKGVPLDLKMRAEAEKDLSEKLAVIDKNMEEAVPASVKKLKVFKKLPKELKGLSEEEILARGYEKVEAEVKTKQCPICQAIDVKANHFKSVGKKALKNGKVENPCFGSKASPSTKTTTFFATRLPFKLSKLGLTGYQKAMNHKAIIDRKKQKVTFDEKAVLQLIKKYPGDRLYPLSLQKRELQKLLGTYIGVVQANGRIKGGLPTGPDGRVHTLFTSNPSTLRSASQNPNLQNIPRPKGKDDPASIIRNLFVASDGHILLARDYSGIEARLVGYFANAPDYIRLTGIDVHSFYTAYAINALDGRIATCDLPQLSWDDVKLRSHLEMIKKEFKADRNNLYKHLVHAINFGQTARGATEKILAETGINYPVATIQRVMDLYKELFPEIPAWHWEVLLKAEKDGFLTNPFGYTHRFTRPFDYEKVDGKWNRKQGPDANKCWAYLPQSSAAGIIKEAMLRLYFERFEEAGQYLRLLIHDELFLEVPESQCDSIDAILASEMEKPILAMPVPASWNMGTHLNVGTEGKRGKRWGQMK